MNTIVDKVNALDETKNLIKTAIINKDVPISESDTFRSYADKISSIGTSGGAPQIYNATLRIESNEDTGGDHIIKEINTTGMETTTINYFNTSDFKRCKKMILKNCIFNTQVWSKSAQMANLEYLYVDAIEYNVARDNAPYKVGAYCYPVIKKAIIHGIDGSQCKGTPGSEGVWAPFAESKTLQYLDMGIMSFPEISKFYNTDMGYLLKDCTALTDVIWAPNSFPDFTGALRFEADPFNRKTTLDLMNKLAVNNNSPSVYLSEASYDSITAEERKIAEDKGWTITRGAV